jgi:carbonic anhydrase
MEHYRKIFENKKPGCNLNWRPDPHAKFNRLAELKVIEECINVIKIDHVQRSWYKIGYPRIYGWVYDLHNGLLRKLDLDPDTCFSSIRGT